MSEKMLANHSLYNKMINGIYELGNRNETESWLDTACYKCSV